jgi:hypothetical protein
MTHHSSCAVWCDTRRARAIYRSRLPGLDRAPQIAAARFDVVAAPPVDDGIRRHRAGARGVANVCNAPFDAPASGRDIQAAADILSS